MQITKIKTDDTFMELTQHGTEEFPFEYYMDELEKYELGYIPMHWHREFEILFVLSGEVDCLIGDRNIKLRTGEGMFISSNVFHQFCTEGAKSTVIPNILFAPEFVADENSRVFKKYITPFLKGNISHVVLKPESGWQRSILEDLLYIHDLFKNIQDMYELMVQEKVIAIWKELCSHMTEMEPEPEKGEAAARARVKKMVMYIESNYMERLVLSDIAQAANISKTEALRCFRKCVNISPVNYLLRYRLQMAGKMLKRTRKSVSEIAAECGFDNVSYFDRMFRRFFELTPSEYRRNIQSWM